MSNWAAGKLPVVNDSYGSSSDFHSSWKPTVKIERQVWRKLWARIAASMLLARIYAVLPLICPFCRAEMRIIAFVTAPATVRRMLEHRGEPTRSPRCAPARGPPLWAAVTAAPPAGNAPHWEQAAQPPPAIECDQRLVW